jgi:cell division transport system permease protein
MQENPIKRKKPSALPGILSLAAVMFMLGLLGTSMVGFKGLGKYWLENTSIDIYFHDSISDSQVRIFETQVQKKSWVKQTKFISREQAMNEMGDKYDPDFMNFVKTVQLPLSVEIYPKSEYAKSEFLNKMAQYYKSNPLVEDVIFQKNWLENISQNIVKIQYALFSIAALLILVSIILIQSNVRLGIYANRHTIKSMQMVGATNAFIIQPFVIKFIQYALFAIPISGVAIWALFWLVPSINEFTGLEITQTSELNFTQVIVEHIDINDLILISLAISVFGVLLAASASWISTRKFLKTKIENLY